MGPSSFSKNTISRLKKTSRMLSKISLGSTIKEMVEAEMNDHLEYEKSGRSDNDDYRNDYKHKQVNIQYGSMKIEVPLNRPLDDVYPILYINAIHYSVRDNGVIRKFAAYVILGINTDDYNR